LVCAFGFREHQVCLKRRVGGLDLCLSAAGDFRIRQRRELLQLALESSLDRLNEDAAAGDSISGPERREQRPIAVQTETRVPRRFVMLTDFERVDLLLK